MQECKIVRDRTAAEDIYSRGISRLRYALPFSVLITALLASFGAEPKKICRPQVPDTRLPC